MNYLAGDIGGTKTRLAIFQTSSNLINIHQKDYSSNQWPSLESILSEFLQTIPNNIDLPNHGCIAVAGAVSNGYSKLTNLGWEIKESKIKELREYEKK